ncbi:putative WEB family protein At4g17210 [Cynara cardunculus var. scolymus]|nr:putative WEB family protein At4g17210 [Cynara cardunculus var. scolymus]
MGEIDTDPIKSVRASVSHFGEKCNQIKSRCSSDDEAEKEKDFEAVLQDLANCKVQLEAMDAAHKQTLLKQDHHEEAVAGISTLLKSSEFEKDVFINECKEARIRVSELEFKIQEMAEELTELSSTRAQLLRVEKQLVAATDAKFEAMKQAEMIETVLSMEKAKMEEMVHHENMLNETILDLRLSSMESESLKEEAEKEMKYAQEQLISKSMAIDSLQSELQRANELHSLAEEAAADSRSDLNRMKEDYKHQERRNSDQVQYIELLESELTQLKSELRDKNQELQMAIGELEKTKSEMEEMGDKDNETQVEIALLKAELHKGRSKTAAAEVSELRAKGEKSAAYFALQQMAIETQELKEENQRLQSGHEEIEFQDSKSDPEITISLAEYEILVKKNEEANDEQNLTLKMECLKKDLESAMVRVSELRTQSEQAATRAEVAEQAKSALEEQIKQWKEQKQRRRAALAALRTESMSKSSHGFEFDDNSKTYMPLGKFLKMNF